MCCVVVFAAAGCVSFSRITAPRTVGETALLSIAAKIHKLELGPEDRGRSDRALEKFLVDAKSAWDESPSRSSTIVSSAGYELEIVILAAVDYYVATGRTGFAIPLLEEAAREARSLRYYVQWQSLTLELVSLYQRVGMIDHARDQIAGQLTFLRRFGYTIAKPPDAFGRDAVLFTMLHATQLEIRPSDYQSTSDLRKLYDLYLRSIEASPQSWGWQPDRGFRYAGLAAPFAIRFAELGDHASARLVRADVVRLHRQNRTVDPFVLANVKKLDFAQSQMGRDLHRLIEFPFAVVVSPFTVRIQDRPAADRRYLAKDPFLEAFELARIDLALGDLESSLRSADQAQALLKPLEEYYARAGDGLAVKDGLRYSARSLSKMRATILESLKRYAEAEALYDDYIAWSERERSSLPIAQRVHFFRGQARAAYWGSIRSSLAQYVASNDVRQLDRILEKSELLRARGFQDLLGIEAGAHAAPKREALQSELRKMKEAVGILQLIDLGDQVATILLTADKVLVSRLVKQEGWDREIFRLRNGLAESKHYDRAAFDKLGKSLLGAASRNLLGLTRLYVTTDGALSALPISILPYAPGRMLHEQLRVTLVPSLSLWLANRDDPDAVDPTKARAFVLGDPTFDAESTIRESIGKEQMAMRGAGALSYFERLPETAEEARAVIGAFGQTNGNKLLLRAEASESRLKAESNLANYTHLHFATHGVIGNDLPNLTEPALVLAWEEGEDGFLTAKEVSLLELDARLTVLSACNTGNGEYFAGEGLMGMGRAFMLAGSDRVIVSLWPVESFSTQRLMELFYARLARGESEDQALWMAQKDLQADVGAVAGADRGIAVSDKGGTTESVMKGSAGYSDPFYWSPFVLISAH